MAGCCLVFLPPFWFSRPSSFLNFRVGFYFQILVSPFGAFCCFVCPYFHFDESFLLLVWVYVLVELWLEFFDSYGKIKPFNMVMVKFVEVITWLLAYSLTNISPSETCKKWNVQVTNFKITYKIYLFHFYFFVNAFLMHESFFICFYEESLHISKFLTTMYM